MQDIGPVSLPNRRGNSLSRFLSRVVTGQQLSINAAKSIWRRVEKVTKENESGIPKFFKDSNLHHLRNCGLSKNKALALIEIRKAHEEGNLSPSKLTKMKADERSLQLQKIWGIGQWTADMTSIFYFGEQDVWPNGDVTVMKTFARFNQKEIVCEQAEIFVPYRSFLALYMYEIADQKLTSS